MKNFKLILLTLISLLTLFSCSTKETEVKEPIAKGKLFIIGGGSKPEEMVQSLIKLSRTDSSGYIVILPMSSSEPKASISYSVKQFSDLGANKVFGMDFRSEEDMTKPRLDSVLNASLIYISGGDQARFMKIVLGTELHSVIKQAYMQGSVISGTSAGAAVMSKKMITGNEYKHPEYTGDFRTIESENIEITEGLGLIDNAIIDQHFVWRMRMNRLISASLENPDETCIGIDESTAICVEGNMATVYGVSQVIVLKNKVTKAKSVNGLLGGSNIELSVMLPGDHFTIKD